MSVASASNLETLGVRRSTHGRPVPILKRNGIAADRRRTRSPRGAVYSGTAFRGAPPSPDHVISCDCGDGYERRPAGLTSEETLRKCVLAIPTSGSIPPQVFDPIGSEGDGLLVVGVIDPE